jgi:hypothetical protein
LTEVTVLSGEEHSPGDTAAASVAVEAAVQAGLATEHAEQATQAAEQAQAECLTLQQQMTMLAETLAETQSRLQTAEASLVLLASSIPTPGEVRAEAQEAAEVFLEDQEEAMQEEAETPPETVVEPEAMAEAHTVTDTSQTESPAREQPATRPVRRLVAPRNQTGTRYL